MTDGRKEETTKQKRERERETDRGRAVHQTLEQHTKKTHNLNNHFVMKGNRVFVRHETEEKIMILSNKERERERANETKKEGGDGERNEKRL